MWRRPKRSELRPFCGWGGGWMRWLPFWVLLGVGIVFAGELRAVFRPAPWFPWLLFFLFWIPFALRASRQFSLWMGRSRGPLTGEHRRAFPFGARCPHCKGLVQREHAICPHCYEDLRDNCRECGKSITVGDLYCADCAKDRSSKFSVTRS